MVSEFRLVIEGNRATLLGRGFGNALLVLSKRLEGQKKWLKAGGFSFEATPLNLSRFKEAFPGATIEGEPQASSLFEGIGSSGLPERAHYKSKVTPFKFQENGIAKSLGRKEPHVLGRGPAHADGSVILLPDLNKTWQPPPAANDDGPVPAAFALLGEMGTGKSKILVDGIGELWCRNMLDAVLICSPKGVHTQWVEEQFPEHLGDMVPWQGAVVNGKKDIPNWQSNRLHVLSVNIDYIRLKHGFQNCMDFVRRYPGRVMMIVDESHDIKNFTSSRTESAVALGRACAFRRIATGTPISLNLIDAFSQFYFLDRTIFGMEYIVSFRNEYCIMGGAEMRTVVAHKNVEQFWEKIDPHCFRITKDEADLELPERFFVNHPFELSAEQKSHYLSMKADMLTRMESGDLLDAKNAVSQMMRLQQIACGYLFKAGDKDKGIPDVTQPLENARMTALLDVIRERQDDSKVVIWARFNEDVEGIIRALGAEHCLDYYGPTPQKRRDINKVRFKDPNDPARFLVGSPAAGGTGLNLQGNVRTVIYYSNSFDAIDRWQSQDRVHRIGALHNITYFDLIAKGTIDTRVLANLRAKKSLADLALDDIRQVLLAA